MSHLITRSPMVLRRLATTESETIDPRSRYVDHFWMPTIGPVAVCLARVLMRMVSRTGEAVTVERTHLATVLGLPADGDDHLDDAFDRLAATGIIAIDDGTVHVRPDFPYLDDHQTAALPESLATAHRVPSSLLAATNLELAGVPTQQTGQHARALSLAATVEEILVNPGLDASQRARRWQHVLRLAEEARDDALLEWAPGDLEATLAEAQLSGQAMAEALWDAQRSIVTRRKVGSESRSALTDAAAGVIDWLVSEFPTDPDGGLDLDDL